MMHRMIASHDRIAGQKFRNSEESKHFEFAFGPFEKVKLVRFDQLGMQVDRI